MRRGFIIALTSISLAAAWTPVEAATKLSVTIGPSSRRLEAGTRYFLKGKVTPARQGLIVSRELMMSGRWVAMGESRTNAAGNWSMQIIAPPVAQTFIWRASVRLDRKTYRSSLATVQTIVSVPVVNVDAVGPGGKVLGVSTGQWGAGHFYPISLKPTFDLGVRFALIRASSGRSDRDLDDLQALAVRRTDVQAAGIYTGLYHVGEFPDLSDSDAIVADARAQADKMLWRIALTGGLTNRDLSPTLFLDSWCTAKDSRGLCLKSAKSAEATLWVLSWLKYVHIRTGRVPMIGSSLYILSKILAPVAELRSYPLVVITAGVDPGISPMPSPFRTASGECFATAWTDADCTGEWTLWMYKQDPVIGQRMIANNSSTLANLLAGNWTPSKSDFPPIGDRTQIEVDVSGLTRAGGLVHVTVRTGNGALVNSGSIKFEMLPASGQSYQPTRISQSDWGVGRWTVKVEQICPDSVSQARVTFSDATGAFARSVTTLDLPIVVLPSSCPQV